MWSSGGGWESGIWLVFNMIFMKIYCKIGRLVKMKLGYMLNLSWRFVYESCGFVSGMKRGKVIIKLLLLFSIWIKMICLRNDTEKPFLSNPFLRSVINTFRLLTETCGISFYWLRIADFYQPPTFSFFKWKEVKFKKFRNTIDRSSLWIKYHTIRQLAIFIQGANFNLTNSATSSLPKVISI